jgi:hypothetical protein
MIAVFGSMISTHTNTLAVLIVSRNRERGGDRLTLDLGLMGISLCTYLCEGGFFSPYIELLLEQLGQHLGLLLEQLEQQHLGWLAVYKYVSPTP